MTSLPIFGLSLKLGLSDSLSERLSQKVNWPIVFMRRCFLCSENYLFHCTCDKCQLEADQPDTTSEEEDDDDDDDGDSMQCVE